MNKKLFYTILLAVVFLLAGCCRCPMSVANLDTDTNKNTPLSDKDNEETDKGEADSGKTAKETETEKNVKEDVDNPLACGSDKDCENGNYCVKACGDKTGVCENKTYKCDGIFEPVCGCDGKTYGNDCSAAMSGVSIDYEGECK